MFSPHARPAILSALAALALYAVTIPGTYVYDDLYIVQLDPRINNVSQWSQFWTKDYFNGGADNLYRPLVSMSYAIQAKLHGNGDNRAWAFHLVNWLLHAGVCAAVAELARRMTRNTTVALLAGLLFAAHPIHVEAVANIIGRAELMCALGMLVALILFLKPMTTPRAIAIWACFVFALLSKEQGILLPLLLLAAIPLRQRRPDPIAIPSPSPPVVDYYSPTNHDWQRPAMLTLIPLLLWTAAGYILLRERILKFWWDRSFLDYTINPLIRSEGRDRLLVPIAMLGRYVALLIAPLRLSLDWGGNLIGSTVSFDDPFLIIGAATIIAWSVACGVAIRRRAWSVAACLFAIALLWGMVSNLPTIIGVNFAERLMYTPSAFVCILLALATARIPRRALVPLTAVAIALLSLRTVTYAWQWNDRLRLYQYSTSNWPQSVRLQLLLGEEYLRRGQLEGAEQSLRRAREIDPNYYKLWITSAVIARSAGHLDEAIAFARRAAQLQPTMGTTMLVADLENQRAATQPASRPTTRPSP